MRIRILASHNPTSVTVSEITEEMQKILDHTASSYNCSGEVEIISLVDNLVKYTFRYTKLFGLPVSKFGTIKYKGYELAYTTTLPNTYSTTFSTRFNTIEDITEDLDMVITFNLGQAYKEFEEEKKIIAKVDRFEEDVRNLCRGLVIKYRNSRVKLAFSYQTNYNVHSGEVTGVIYVADKTQGQENIMSDFEKAVTFNDAKFYKNPSLISKEIDRAVKWLLSFSY